MASSLLVTAVGTAFAAGAPYEGNWEGRGFTGGRDECPSFKISLTVSGSFAKGRFIDGQHGMDFESELADDGSFTGSFQTASGHLVRVEGGYDGQQLKGRLRHPICSGTWYVDRVE